MATYINLSEGEGGGEDVTIFCKQYREEILPGQPHRATNDPDIPGEIMHLHDSPEKPCWNKWHDERRRRIQSAAQLGLQSLQREGE